MAKKKLSGKETVKGDEPKPNPKEEILAQHPRAAAIMEAKKANPHIELRLETFRQRFFELEGRYPNQNEIPQSLGGSRT